ncbi:MAG: right-handed parallel beta-helix repeat-containing protein, partial [Verrucomicrobia bacterium]|nr:right-handed parallel beta-helix repeat-containing protein [Verrucomicrobiota bacterium]
MRLLVVASVVVAAVVCSPALWAATMYVDDDAPNDPGPGDPGVSDPLEDGSEDHPFDAIQEGINAAVAGDTVLVKDGTYTGVGNRGISFGGKAVTVQSENGADTCIIDCQNAGLGFIFHSDETAVSIVDGFTITNSPIGTGGAIDCDFSSPTISDCIITGNDYGIECTMDGSPTITGCTISGNTRSGIYCNSTSATINACTLIGNKKGIDCTFSPNLSISSCIVSTNTETGISCRGCNLQIDNCTISNNLGAGISCDEYCDATITKCTITANAGGIVCSFHCDLTITNCVISGNSSSTGSGISCDISSYAGLTNCTITDNEASGRGGGIRCDNGSSASMTNCILWGNTAFEGDQIALYSYNSPSTLIVRYSDVEGAAGEAYIESGSTLDLNGTNIDVNPLLSVGGYLMPSSPCIDRCPTGPAEDFEGNARPYDVPGVGNEGVDTYDMGADEYMDSDGDGLPDWWEFEYFGSATAADPEADEEPDGLTNIEEYENGTNPINADTDTDGRTDGQEITDGTNPLYPDNAEKTYYVDGATGSDAYDGLAIAWDGTHGPKLTIQAGIDATITGWDYTVIVADGIYTGAGNKDLSFGGKAITVQSENGAAACVIDCEGAGRGVTFESGETAASVLDGFTITNAYLVNYGGGIFCSCTNATIANCTITGNTGSGIHCVSHGDVTIINCSITGNDGVGVYCHDASQTYSDCSPTITNCIIADNTNSGIYCWTGNPTIINCTITGNTSSSSGGGIFCYAGSHLTITNSILWGNAAPTGHEIALEPYLDWEIYCPNLTIQYCDIQGGEAEVSLGPLCTIELDETNIDANPLFVSGPLHDYCLSQMAAGQAVDSPCVDAGSDTAVNLGLDHLTTRTDGVPDSGIVDMGYHAPVVIYVDDDAPSDPGPGDPTVSDPLEDGSAEHPFDAIQKGIDAAGDGGEVIVLPGTYTGPGNRDLDFGGKAMTVRSSVGPLVTIIDCAGLGRGFSFHSGETSKSVLDGFTITNARVSGTADEDKGGGIYCEGSSPTIQDCRFISNTVEWCGGGIGCNASSPTIRNCVFEGNQAYYGGALDFDNSPATVTNCMISGNTATRKGAGINCYGPVSPSIVNCTVTGNSAAVGGGGYYSWNCNTTITNTILWGNDPDEIEALSGDPVVSYCNIQGSTDQSWSGTGCIEAAPLFVAGPLHKYYLSQTAAGQAANSPCVDAGSDTAANLGL